MLGAGILLGTALAVIIPEGIETIASSQRINLTPTGNHQLLSQNHSQVSKSFARSEPNSEKKDELKEQASHKLDSQHEEQTIGAALIGLSLICGFIIMLAFDQILLYKNRVQSKFVSSPPPQGSSTYLYKLASQRDDNNSDSVLVNSADAIEIDDGLSNQADKLRSCDINPNCLHNRRQASLNDDYTGDEDEDEIVFDSTKSRFGQSASVITSKATPTLGLVVHSAIEGIAMGAAATSPRHQVEIIVFSAITLHKAPAAFSLVVFLLHMKTLTRAEIRRHLLAFSLSSPLSALLTFICLSKSGKEVLRQNGLTGIALLFSAGTFLYVATVHVLPELVHNKLLSRREFVCLIGGAFLPLLLSKLL